MWRRTDPAARVGFGLQKQERFTGALRFDAEVPEVNSCEGSTGFCAVQSAGAATMGADAEVSSRSET